MTLPLARLKVLDVSQVMAGELTLEQAYERMNQDIAEQVATAKR